MSLRKMGWHTRRLWFCRTTRVRGASGTDVKVPAPKSGLSRCFGCRPVDCQQLRRPQGARETLQSNLPPRAH